ncbi:MAG: hypothetical protein COV66_14200 [Nitrospinae bacterium CG11_big_fil_rev_8_21_14_0_20_45_15]|nr:MAG: hypothetical protein COV66_14200 [Nitrospinae bacterium CG11_big_fil_rev_8_21_14_0_20_45_15]
MTDITPHSILIADDDSTLRDLFFQTLSPYGYNITLCKDGADALEKIKGSLFDLLLLDLDMGDISGIDVLKQAKAIDPDVLVMIITGNPSLDTAIQALKLNAYDYIQKPCMPSELTFKVNKCLEYCDQKRRIAEYEKFLHFCAICKKVCKNVHESHNEENWVTIETYLKEKAKTQSYLGYCPGCINEVKEQISNS